MKKALKIIVPILLVALVIFYIVAYILWKEQTTYITECIINFINKPVVIAGVSTTIGGLFVLLLVKYIVNNSKFGKQRLKEIEKDNEKLKERINEQDKDIDDFKEWAKKELGYHDEYIGVLFETLYVEMKMSKNIKIRELADNLTIKGEQPYGEEEVDSQEETETL